MLTNCLRLSTGLVDSSSTLAQPFEYEIDYKIVTLLILYTGSATWTRTRNQSITLILKLLLGMDYIITIVIVDHRRCKALGAVQWTELLPEGIVSEPSRHRVSLGCWLSSFEDFQQFTLFTFLNFFRKLRNAFEHFLPQSIALPLSYRGIFVCKKTSSLGR